MSDRYVLGLDFGTLSVRAAVINTADGSTLGEKVSEYATPVWTARSSQPENPSPPTLRCRYPATTSSR